MDDLLAAAQSMEGSETVTPAPPRPKLRLENISFVADCDWNLENMDLDFPEGRCTAILGPSGSGKSLILKLAAGIYVPEGGKIFYEDQDISLMSEGENLEFRKKTGFVFQDSALWANKSVYQNHYFGLTVALPPEWSVQDQETRQKMMELGGKMVAGDDKNLNAAVKASEMTTVNLFAAFKHPVGTPVPYNPNIMCLAERVRHMPGIKEGKDYLFHAKRMLESSHMQVSFPKEMSAESMGGQQFGVMHTEMSMAGEAIRQKYYAAIIKDYALVFIVSFTTEEDELSLEKTLKTVEFK